MQGIEVAADLRPDGIEVMPQHFLHRSAFAASGAEPTQASVFVIAHEHIAEIEDVNQRHG